MVSILSHTALVHPIPASACPILARVSHSHSNRHPASVMDDRGGRRGHLWVIHRVLRVLGWLVVHLRPIVENLRWRKQFVVVVVLRALVVVRGRRWGRCRARGYTERESTRRRDPFFVTLILPPSRQSSGRKQIGNQTKRRRPSCTRHRRGRPLWQCTSDNSHITTHWPPNTFNSPFFIPPPSLNFLRHLDRHPHNEALFHIPSTFQYATCLFCCLLSRCEAARGCKPIHPI
jgi:hypothetical protein